MATLFGKKHKSRKRVRQEDGLVAAVEQNAPASDIEQQEQLSLTQVQKQAAAIVDEDVDAQPAARSFQELGLCSWICDSCIAMGFKRPTPVQSTCIPAIIAGKDVLACAETGSGKTAAFALPILHKLSQDPYGVFAVVLTPTRELALQIAEQFEALGTPMGLRYELVIGGVNMMRQSLALKERPHVIIATPGRLRHHLEGPDPPDLSKVKYLVLDEADRLLTIGFQSELQMITHAIGERRQTLLFSATLTASIEELEQLAMKDACRYDLTKKQQMPEHLLQQYLFIPPQVKTAFLVVLLQKIIADETPSQATKKRLQDDEDTPLLKSSVMIFTSSCQRCQEINELLLQLGIQSVALHSAMTQNRRIAALGKFKSQLVRVLVSTDVANRGLDIPQVDLVVNYDLPRLPADYVHRVGRTARAGRSGRSVSLVTPSDVQLVHAIEEYINRKLELCEDVNERDVVPILNSVAKAQRLAKQQLMETGFEERLEVFHERRIKQRKRLRAKLQAQESTKATTFSSSDVA